MSAAAGKLVLFIADGTTLHIPFDHERLTVGRRPGNDVCLPFPTVSGKHAVFTRTPDGVVMEDLGSTNGTMINGKRATRHLLHDGDRLDIGRQHFVYFADPKAVVPSQPRRRASPGAAREQATVTAASDRRKAPGEHSGPATVLEAPAVRRPRDAAPMLDVPTDADAAEPGEAVAPEERGPPEAPETAADVMSESHEPEAEPAPVALDPALDLALADLLAQPRTDAAPEATPGAADQPLTEPTLEVLTGPNAGRRLALPEGEVLIGRVGLQVVAVRRGADGIRLALSEGAEPPSVNGVVASPEGALLKDGDAIDVAGSRLRLMLPSEPGVR